MDQSFHVIFTSSIFTIVKTKFSVFFALWFVFSASARGEGEEQRAGYVRFVNVVTAGEGRLQFFQDGQTLYKKGYKTGQATGGIGLLEGVYTIKARKEGCEDGELKLDLRKGSSQTVIAYAVPKKNKAGEILAWKIRLELLKGRQVSGYEATCVSFCRDKTFQLSVGSFGQKPVAQVTSFLSVSHTSLVPAAGDVLLTIEGKRFYSFSTEDSGSYVAILYETKEGGLKALHFYDPVY